jgi:hypothetical protein
MISADCGVEILLAAAREDVSFARVLEKREGAEGLTVILCCVSQGGEGP